MPPVQTTYSDEMPIAVAGLQGTQIPATVISRTNEDVTNIGFGKAVSRGVDDHGCAAFSGSKLALLGITLLDRSTGAETDGFTPKESVRIMTKGHVWVVASVAVNDGDPVYVIPATNKFAKTNASSAVLLANAVWETTTNGTDQLALIRLT